jgi:hypothetical protein
MCVCRRLFFMSDRESYLYPICMKSDGESDAKTYVSTAPSGGRCVICVVLEEFVNYLVDFMF